MVGAIGQADELEDLVNAASDLRLRRLGQQQGSGDVLRDGLGFQQVVVLEDHRDLAAQLAQLLRAQLGRLAAEHCDGAGGGRLKAVDRADQRGLARTRRADDTVDAARGDGERDVVERGERASGGIKDLGDVVEGDGGAGHCSDSGRNQ